jgi:chorismate dehydratase
MPLVEGYETLRELADFRFVVPSQLSVLLARGELDIALVSSVEYLRGGYEILPRVGIVSRGAVNSVLLTGMKPVEEAETVNLDPSSLTSRTLTALWYRLRLGRTPKFSRHPIGSDQALRCDAQLAIGDEGLFRSGRAPYQLDLGAAWEEWIGHPFVYAVWVIRKGVELGAVAPFLVSAPAQCRKSLGALAEEASRRLGLSGDVCVRYLTHSLQFRLDEDAFTGLEAFLNMAGANHAWLSDIIPDIPPLGIDIPVQIELYSPSASQFSMES